MKKTLYSLIVLLMLIGCSSSNEQEVTFQMGNLKWTWTTDWYSEEEVSKQLNLFELIPGAQKFYLTTYKKPGKTEYYMELELKVKLNTSVDINLDEILSDNSKKWRACNNANIYAYLLDRNGERIPIKTEFGIDFFLIMFNENSIDLLIDYLTFLQSEPGTEYDLYFYAGFPEEYIRGFDLSKLAKEVKGAELEINSSDDRFEENVGVIK